jgi:hypothetical protein
MCATMFNCSEFLNKYHISGRYPDIFSCSFRLFRLYFTSSCCLFCHLLSSLECGVLGTCVPGRLLKIYLPLPAHAQTHWITREIRASKGFWMGEHLLLRSHELRPTLSLAPLVSTKGILALNTARNINESVFPCIWIYSAFGKSLWT